MTALAMAFQAVGYKVRKPPREIMAQSQQAQSGGGPDRDSERF